jgi:hypothetical protein
MSIRRGEEWSRPATAAADADLEGDDAALARWAVTRPGGLVAFRPDSRSDIARALGLTPGAVPGGDREVELDAIAVRAADGADGAVPAVAANMVVLGTPPDRLGRLSRSVATRIVVDGAAWFDGDLTTAVVANGQFLRGLDVAPRGHPGDGRLEVQAYHLAPGERRGMRARLGSGTHLPHPRIGQQQARRVEIRARRPLALEVDGARHGRVGSIDLEVVAGAFRLLV